jgi:hypothetical protein
VTFDSGGRGGNLRFRIEDASGTVVYENTAADGAYNGRARFRLAPGKYTAEVRCPPFLPARLAFEAAEGAIVKIPQVLAAK